MAAEAPGHAGTRLQPHCTSEREAWEHSGWGSSVCPATCCRPGLALTLGPGSTLLASPHCLSSAVNQCPSAGTNHSCGQGRVSPPGGPRTLNLHPSSEGWARQKGGSGAVLVVSGSLRPLGLQPGRLLCP